MKRVMLLIVFTFPIIIFVILNVFASVFARFVPVAVESVRFAYSEISVSRGEKMKLQYTVYPELARNREVDFFVDADGEEILTVDKNGNVHILDYGYAEITVKTRDGNYIDSCVVMVTDPNDDPSKIRAIYLSYKQNIHSSYLFGDSNLISLSYKYYPKTAVDDVEFRVENGTVSKSGENLSVNFYHTGENTLFAASQPYAAQAKYTFNVRSGANLNKTTTAAQIQDYLNGYMDLFLTEDIFPEDVVTVKYNAADGTGNTIYGNGCKWNHSNLKYYLQNDVATQNISAINLQSKCGISNLRIVGKVSPQNLMYDRVSNVGIVGKNDFSDFDPDFAFDDDISIENCIIENGRYNISIYGGYNLKIFDTRLVGSVISSIQVNNPVAPGALVNSTTVFLRDIYIDLTTIGIMVENNESAGAGVKGYSRVTILPSLDPEKASIISDSWRNIDEAKSTNSSSGLNVESAVVGYIARHGDVVKNENDNLYVNCLIAKMGGRPNYSQINIEDGILNGQLKKITHNLSNTETLYVGGKTPFDIYCFYA